MLLIRENHFVYQVFTLLNWNFNVSIVVIGGDEVLVKLATCYSEAQLHRMLQNVASFE